MSEMFSAFTVVALLIFGFSYCSLKTLENAALLDLKLAGIDVQTKGEWIKFSNQGVWCRPAKEYSEHAEICQEEEPSK